jgi:hypothetical protein
MVSGICALASAPPFSAASKIASRSFVKYSTFCPAYRKSERPQLVEQREREGEENMGQDREEQEKVQKLESRPHVDTPRSY